MCAVERIKEFSLDLGDLVKMRLDGFADSRQRIQAEQEAKFQRIVSEQGMSYVDQLQYKKDILSREKDKAFVNIDYVESIKSDISNLRKLARYETIRKEYLENYTEYGTSKITIDSFISSIERQLENVVDPDLRKELEGSLSEARIEKVNSQRQILENRVVLAKSDKSVELLDKTISEVLVAKNQAVTTGDDAYSTSLDIHLQSLRSQKQKINAETKRHDFDLQAISGASDSIGKLDMLDGAIQSADIANQFMVGGKTYSSEQEYWTFQRDSYLAGSGSGEFQNFFNDFDTETKDRLDTVSTTNRFGSVPISTIASVDQGYKDLLQREEFALYQGRIETKRLSALTYATDKTAAGIVEESDLHGEFTKGNISLTALQNQFGIDLSNFVTDLKYKELNQPTRFNALMTAAEFKAAQKLGVAAEDLNPIDNPEHKRLIDEEFSRIAETPLPEEGSILQNVEEKVIVPQLEEKKEELVTKVAETKKAIEEKEKVAPTPTEEGTYRIASGDTLSKIAARHGTSVSDLMASNTQIKDPNKIYAGQSLTIPTTKAPVKPAAPAPAAAQAPVPSPKPVSEIKYYRTPQGAYLKTEAGKVSSPNVQQIKQLRAKQIKFEEKSLSDVRKLVKQ